MTSTSWGVRVALHTVVNLQLTDASGDLEARGPPGSRPSGRPAVWNLDVVTLLDIVLANILVVLFGFMLGVLVRGSAGAIVAYFVYAFLMPTVTDLLAVNQQWFHDLQPWVDPAIAQHELFHGALTVEQWSQLGLTSLIWLVVPLLIGLRVLLRSEVK